MKKIVAIICLIMVTPYVAHAVTTCLRTNAYVGIFKKSVDSTTTPVTDSTNKTWKIIFDYATITGLAACNEISGTANTPTTNLVTNAADEGPHCWCEMWPVEDYGYESGPTSYWIYLQAYANASTCASSCTSACATAVATDDTFRSAMFESMW